MSVAQAPAKSRVASQQLADAIAYEAAIAADAAEIRGEAATIDAPLFAKLYPLLCKPIPEGFIQTIGSTNGKPYESTGIRSVQVQIDRMNNVLTPPWWWYEDTYEDGGKLARVEVFVGDPSEPKALVARSARGGVGHGSGAGNIYKGSFTNAGKLAFARLGPGHEVYLGAADLDPDVNQEIAEQSQASGGNTPPPRPVAKIGLNIAGTIWDHAQGVEAARKNLRLAVSHIINRDIGPLDDRETAVGGLADGLTFEQAEQVQRWIERKRGEGEAAIADGGGSGE